VLLWCLNRSLDVGQYIKTHLQPSSSAADADTVYDLYGVVNHTGGLLGGHYTAYAHTPHPTATEKREFGMSIYNICSSNDDNEKSIQQQQIRFMVFSAG